MSLEEYRQLLQRFSGRPVVARVGRALYYLGILVALGIMYGHLGFTVSPLFYQRFIF